MREVALFGEDRAHQLIVGALLRRLAEEHRVEISLVWRQAYGGHGRMKRELNDYLRALRQQQEPLPDLIVAATDANCKGLNARTREIGDPTCEHRRWFSPFRTKDAHRDSYASNSLSSSSTTRFITNLPSLLLGPVLRHSTDRANVVPTPVGSMISPVPLLPVRRPNEPKAVRQRVPPTTAVNAASSSSSNSSKSDRRSRNTRSTSSVVQFPNLTHTTLGG